MLHVQSYTFHPYVVSVFVSEQVFTCTGIRETARIFPDYIVYTTDLAEAVEIHHKELIHAMKHYVLNVHKYADLIIKQLPIWKDFIKFENVKQDLDLLRRGRQDRRVGLFL